MPVLAKLFQIHLLITMITELSPCLQITTLSFLEIAVQGTHLMFSGLVLLIALIFTTHLSRPIYVKVPTAFRLMQNSREICPEFDRGA